MPRFEKNEDFNLPAYIAGAVYANVYQTGATTAVALIDWRARSGRFARIDVGDLLETVTEGEAVYVVAVIKENELLAKGYTKRNGI